jgi:hypothetical protein
MNCQEVRRHLLEEGPAAVEAHLAGCADCRRVALAVAEADDAVHRVVEQWEQQPFQAALQRARAAVRPTGWRMFVQTGLLGLVAAAALVVATAGPPRLAPKPEPTEPTAAASGAEAEHVRQELARLANIPLNAFSDSDWAAARAELVALEPAIGDDVALRFGFCARLGQVAENANDPSPPFYLEVTTPGGPALVNAYWWEAAGLALERPELLSQLPTALRERVQASVDQRTGSPKAVVPAGPDRVRLELERVETIPWNAFSDGDWRVARTELAALEPAIGDDMALRFRFYAQLGRVAEFTNDPSPPFYRQTPGLGGKVTYVNVYWWEAAGLALQRPELLESLPPELRERVQASVELRRP